MNIHLTRKQADLLLKALDGPSVADQRMAQLYDVVRSALEEDRKPKLKPFNPDDNTRRDL